MKYRYEDLGDDQFEELIVVLCRNVLGRATIGFSKGRDGGRDAKFVGTANDFPSRTSPWQGTTIIQAKHTNGINKSFSNTDFFDKDRKNTIIGKEIPRIKNLRSGGKLDHYILFSNRKLSSLKESEIRSYISVECDLPEESIYLCGLEMIELWLKEHPDVVKTCGIDPIDFPLMVSPDDLADIIEAIAAFVTNIPKHEVFPPIERTSLEKKNAINNMTKEYSNELCKRYLKETRQIGQFLALPENETLREKYSTCVEEFRFKIIGSRKDYRTFDKIMNYLMDLLVERDTILKRNKTLTRAMLFYMYWNCDIGESQEC
ncbi:hypothetical protein FAI40_10200 [Acetobacteraceae bacterium]|nr:hypothetical protein FAI40_10200 [Acetobacteraceae bacterium]